MLFHYKILSLPTKKRVEAQPVDLQIGKKFREYFFFGITHFAREREPKKGQATEINDLQWKFSKIK